MQCERDYIYINIGMHKSIHEPFKIMKYFWLYENEYFVCGVQESRFIHSKNKI